MIIVLYSFILKCIFNDCLIFSCIYTHDYFHLFPVVRHLEYLRLAIIWWRSQTNLELSSGGRTSCSTGFPGLAECSRNPSVSMFHLVLLWKAVVGFREFSLRLFQHVYPFHHGWFQVYLPTTHWVFSLFWPKMAWTPCLILLIHMFWPSRDSFFVSLDEESPQREMSWPYGNGKSKKQKQNKKTAEALKGVKIDAFRNYFEQWKKIFQ